MKKYQFLLLFIVAFGVLGLFSCAGDSTAATTVANGGVPTIDSTAIRNAEAEALALRAAKEKAIQDSIAQVEKAKEEERLALLEKEEKAKKAKAEKRRKAKAKAKKLAEQKRRERAEARRISAAEKKRQAEAAAAAAFEASPTPQSGGHTQVAPAPKPARSSKGGPKIKFFKKNYNFGTIKEGDVVKYEFEYTNEGTEDLIITDAKVTCGCTAPGFSFFPLQPGLSSAISVSFNSAHKIGPQKPTVTIYTNSVPSTHVLTMEGNVVQVKEEKKEAATTSEK